LQRPRVLDDPGEGGKSRAAEPRALAVLEPSQRGEDRLVLVPPADRRNERRFPGRHLVEEEILLRRKVVVDSLLGDLRGGGDLSYGDSVEAALGEQLHRLIGDLAPRP